MGEDGVHTPRRHQHCWHWDLGLLPAGARGQRKLSLKPPGLRPPETNDEPPQTGSRHLRGDLRGDLLGKAIRHVRPEQVARKSRKWAFQGRPGPQSWPHLGTSRPPTSHLLLAESTPRPATVPPSRPPNYMPMVSLTLTFVPKVLLPSPWKLLMGKKNQILTIEIR